MPRFNLGERVSINPQIAAGSNDRNAIVVGVYPSRFGRSGTTSLDKYIVRFVDGKQSEFYDIQLTAGWTSEPAGIIPH